MAGKDDNFEELMKSAGANRNAGDFEGAVADIDEAITDLDEAIRLDPENANAWYNRGAAKSLLERYEEAITDFGETLRIDPKNANAWYNRGLQKINLNRYEEAITDLDEAIRLDPDDKGVLASAYINRGAAKSRLNGYEEAITDYDKAIGIDPKNAIAWYNRGAAKSRLNRLEEAITDLEEARRIDPEDASAQNYLAAIKAEQAAREAVEERIGSLKADTKEIKAQAEEYRESEKENRDLASQGMERLRNTVSILIGGLIVLILVSVILDALKVTDTNIVSSPFSLLPWITMIVIITAPLVWTIRLQIAEANSAKIMQAEYSHLAYVEGRMIVYFPNQDTAEDNKVRADYIKTTMINSPADKLLALQDKANVPSPNPVQNVVETIRSKASGNLPS